MQTWGQLKADARGIIFPQGEASNLVKSHDAAFIAAIIDLQQFVDCLRSDNVSVFPQCATFYNCGITTFDAPRGRITGLSVIDSKPVPAPTGDVVLTTTLTPDITGAETQPVSIGTAPSSDLFVVEITGQGSGCGKPVPQYFKVSVIYTDNTNTVKSFSRNVYVSDCATNQTQQINTLLGTNVYVSVKPVNQPVATGSASIVVNVRKFNPLDVTVPTPDWCSEIQYRQTSPAYVQKYWKRSRECKGVLNPWFFFDLKPPTPTEANVPAGLPMLPLGFHYPQADTDKKHRSHHGLWALEQQKIFIAPWINSTEIVIVRWDGIKRDWQDSDPIDDDPLLAEAIRAYVRKDHYTYWERDAEMANAADAAWNDARSRLIMECREETRVRSPDKEPSFARQSNPGVVGNLFYNTSQSFTASCPAGTIGDSVTIQIAAGLVASAVSQADADAKAQAQAQAQAIAQLNCQTPPTTYSSAAQSFTAVCTGNGIAPTPDGTPQTVNIPSGAFTSTISQADADAQALAAAQVQAQSLLSCMFWNSIQTYTAVCPVGQTGASVTKTVAAHTFSSTLSQADADAQALNSATLQANTALVCNSVSPTFFNTPQSATKSFTIKINGPDSSQPCTATVTVNVGANRFSSTSSIGAANAAALAYANALATGTAQRNAQTRQCGSVTLNV